MLPSAYPYDLERLRDAWEAIVRDRTASYFGIDPAVERSWSRCCEDGLDPTGCVEPETLSPDELRKDREDWADMIALSRPLMEDVYQFAGERDMVIYLTDRSLHLVEWLGDEKLADHLQGAGLGLGVNLDETQVGTNAAALVFNEGLPYQVVGPEHFCGIFHDFTDTAAPICEPSGEMVGAIGILTMEQKSNPHTLGIVMASARAIENQLQARRSLAEAHQHLAELNASLQAMSKGVVFLDPEGKVTHINTSAGSILSLSPRQARGRFLRTLVEIPPEVNRAMAQRSSLSQREVIFKTNDEARPCLLDLDVLKGGRNVLGFILTLSNTSEARQLVHQMVGAQAHFTFDDIIGEDVKIKRLLYYARAIARSDAPVLLLGESGTGKEFFAQSIHNASPHGNGPFIAVDCAAIPRSLMAQEMFGIEEERVRGEPGRPGKFELADGGTVFFDNVDSMPLNIQASLLRVIDTKGIVRLGGNRFIPLDVRIIASSSNVDLVNEVREGRFRSDLFYHLQALTLTIPPLRERGNDVLLLAAHLVGRFSERVDREIAVSPGAMGVLQSYHWPGNVRELENVLEWALHMVDGNELRVEHLPQELRRATIGGNDETILTMEEAERQAIIKAGQALQGNVTKMAEALEIGRTTLWRKMKAYNLSAESFKSRLG